MLAICSDDWHGNRLFLVFFFPPLLSVHGILEARILEWVAVPCPDLPNPGIEPTSPTLQADSLLSEPKILEWVVNPFSRGSS